MKIINVEILKNGYSKRQNSQLFEGFNFKGRTVCIEYKKSEKSSFIYRDVYNKEGNIIYSDSFKEEIK